MLERETVDNVVNDEVGKVTDKPGSGEILDLRPVIRITLQLPRLDRVKEGVVPLFKPDQVGTLLVKIPRFNWNAAIEEAKNSGSLASLVGVSTLTLYVGPKKT